MSFYYYDCNITVFSSPSDLSPEKGAIAAQAVALSGQRTADSNSINQYTAYPFSLPTGEVQNNSATGMAGLLSQYAIGVVAAAAQSNPPNYVLGGQPTQGMHLKLKHPHAFNAIIGLISGVQLVLVLGMAGVLSRVVIPGEILYEHEREVRTRFVD